MFPLGQNVFRIKHNSVKKIRLNFSCKKKIKKKKKLKKFPQKKTIKKIGIKKNNAKIKTEILNEK